MLKIVISGASGRMGRALIETALSTKDITLHGVLTTPNSPLLGVDAGVFLGKITGVLISCNADACLKDANCLIDFTRPEASIKYLDICVQHQVNMVIGTTGFDESSKKAIQTAGQHIGIVFAPNMGVGVNATLKILELATRILNTGYDIEIIEAHHRLKVDAPSGTALKMGEVIAQTLKRDLDTCAIYDRKGITDIRKEVAIGFSTIRGGDIVGEHTVMFLGDGERIEITHKSSSRKTYATGSIRAALFLEQQKPGVYDMQKVLDL